MLPFFEKKHSFIYKVVMNSYSCITKKKASDHNIFNNLEGHKE